MRESRRERTEEKSERTYAVDDRIGSIVHIVILSRIGLGNETGAFAPVHHCVISTNQAFFCFSFEIKGQNKRMMASTVILPTR